MIKRLPSGVEVTKQISISQLFPFLRGIAYWLHIEFHTRTGQVLIW